MTERGKIIRELDKKYNALCEKKVNEAYEAGIEKGKTMSEKEVEIVDKSTGEVTVRKVELTQEQVDLLQRTVCKDHTPDEIQLFIQYCQAKGMDPFGREIYSIKRKDRITFQIGIDALRMKAEETGTYNGQETLWCAEDGKWVDVWVSALPPYAAKVSVFRKGIDKPFVGIALWTEYKPADNDFIWKKMPSNQLAKCAEAIALRKAFPRKLGGLYAAEEMEQANQGTKMPKIAMPKAKEIKGSTDPEIVESGPSGEAEEAPIEFSEPPIGYKREEHAAAHEAQAPRSKEEVEKALRPPKSKYFAMLHKAAREKEVSDEKMKRAVKLYGVESSKDLTDKDCAELIKLIEKGGIK
jgi:phage recombination protein Bet